MVIVRFDNTEPSVQKEDKTLKSVEDKELVQKRQGNVTRYRLNNDCREDKFSKQREQLKDVIKDKEKGIRETETKVRNNIRRRCSFQAQNSEEYIETRHNITKAERRQ